ncbi:MAG: hypothetical protein ACXV5F_08430 [Halobacteriota archaeon]
MVIGIMDNKRCLASVGVAVIVLVSLYAACATSSYAYTGVNASDSSNTPPQGVESAPAVSSWGKNRLDVFVKGRDGNLWHEWYDNGKVQDWESLGGGYITDPATGRTAYVDSNPAAVTSGWQRIDVFVKGSDGQVWQKSYGGRWDSWRPVGAPAGGILACTSPAVSSWAKGLDVFVTGADHQLWQRSYTGTWQAWKALGKPNIPSSSGQPSSPAGVNGSPGAISRPSSFGQQFQQLDVFVRGSDGALWQESYNGLWWGFWSQVPGTKAQVGLELSCWWHTHTFYSYAPAVCSVSANRLDVFFVNTSGLLQQKTYDGSWRPVSNVGGPKFLTSSPSAVVWQLDAPLSSAPTTRIDIFARDGDNALWDVNFNTRLGRWSDWTNINTLRILS